MEESSPIFGFWCKLGFAPVSSTFVIIIFIKVIFHDWNRKEGINLTFFFSYIQQLHSLMHSAFLLPHNHVRAEGLEVATGDWVQSSSSLVLLR